MKLYLVIITFFISSFSFSADYLPYRLIAGPYSMEFPIFDDSASSEAITKINTHLQMAELWQLAKARNKTIFSEVTPNTDDYKKVGMQFHLKENNPRILSMRFDISYSWLTMAYWHCFYNFNPQNGDLIQLEDLFTEAGYKKFKKNVFRKRSKDFSRFFNDSIPEYLDDIIDCYERSNLEGFYIQNNAIYIESMNCFSKGQMFHGANTLYKFSLASFQNDLNDYGQVLFGLKENEKHYGNYIASSLPALYKGTLGGKNVTLLLESKSVYSDIITAQYYYDKYGKCIELTGKLDGNYLKLYEGNAESDLHKGTIMATLESNTIRGAWLGHYSGNYPLRLKRY